MKRLGAVFFGVLMVAISAGAVGAAVAPPTVELFEAYGFENVLEPDDRLILVRYELPFSEWSNASTTDTFPTAFMIKANNETSPAGTDCFALAANYLTDDNNIQQFLEDACFTSLKTGMVLQTFYDGTRGGAGVIQHGIRTLPRIADGLSAIYIRAGHSLAPAGSATANSYQTCIEGSPTIFTGPAYSSQPVACLVPIWYDTVNVEDKSGMTSVLNQLMLNLEEEMILPVNTFVASDKITENGITMPREAFTAMVRAAPDAFYTGVTNPWTDIRQVPTPTVQELAIAGSAESSTIYKAFDGVASQYFGTTGKVFGGLVILMLAAAAVMAVGAVTGSITLGSITGFLLLLVGVFLGIVHIGALWAAIGLLTLVGSMYIFRKMPS